MPLIDTWAWMEYFQGTKTGAKLRPIIEGPAVTTSVLTLAELCDIHVRYRRPGLDDRLSFVKGR